MGLELVENSVLYNSSDNIEIGQSVFVDLDGSLVQDHLVPICIIKGSW